LAGSSGFGRVSSRGPCPLPLGIAQRPPAAAATIGPSSWSQAGAPAGGVQRAASQGRRFLEGVQPPPHLGDVVDRLPEDALVPARARAISAACL
jgi:hypothetical protein